MGAWNPLEGFRADVPATCDDNHELSAPYLGQEGYNSYPSYLVALLVVSVISLTRSMAAHLMKGQPRTPRAFLYHNRLDPVRPNVLPRGDWVQVVHHLW